MASDLLRTQVEGEINAKDVVIGKGVIIESGVVISGKGQPADRVVIGDFAYIGRETKVFAPEFMLGDYSKLHAQSFCHGTEALRIGRNCWIGGNVILDSIGGLDIDDNVGIGAQSQLWTHIQFGDIVEGSRFYQSKYMHVGRDAWFVGHCIVSPVRVAPRSMAMVGSVVTKDMEENRIYAGVPARDITEKVGPQFEERSVEQKAEVLQRLIDDFLALNPEHRGALWIATSPSNRPNRGTWFDVSTRTYNKEYGPAEVAFLKASTPLIKFTPEGEPPFLSPHHRLKGAT